jgi:exodeoxyribonuclease VII small subunit
VLSNRKTAKPARSGPPDRPRSQAGTAAAAKTGASYDGKMKRLEAILGRLDNSETSIDELAQDVKEGVQLIKELNQKLNEVETEVRDAFDELDATVPKGDPEKSEPEEHD